VVDFGAGDARFSQDQSYLEYIGFEVDARRQPAYPLPKHATVRYVCAFSQQVSDADVCIGNPPYVRHQDLPETWDQSVAKVLGARTGVHLSGLANAWQYFFLLSLASTGPDGLVALVIPYEWVSRPSVKNLREYIKESGWSVDVYRLLDDTFGGVMTTASITIIDKRSTGGQWSFFEEKTPGKYQALHSPAPSADGVIAYLKRSSLEDGSVYAKRGLSPGSQRALVLTESVREKWGLLENVDVVPCVTSLRAIEDTCQSITRKVFEASFRDKGARCWLINSEGEPSPRLQAYLDSVDESERQTATCEARADWWRFGMPNPPTMFAATGFTGERPKVANNECKARAVGSVAGIYGVPAGQHKPFITRFRELRIKGRIVPHSNGLCKVEINQLNALIQDVWAVLSESKNGK
jgi:hypothetical protein